MFWVHIGMDCIIVNRNIKGKFYKGIYRKMTIEFMVIFP